MAERDGHDDVQNPENAQKAGFHARAALEVATMWLLRDTC